MMSDGERLWTLPRRLISGTQFLLVLNFLYKNKVRNIIYRQVSICRGELSHILGCKKIKNPLKTNKKPPNHPPFDGFLRITLGSFIFITQNLSLNLN